MGRYVHNKWAKTQVLLTDDTVKNHVPLTKRMDRTNLYEMLHKYRMVYIKPITGTYGNGVMRVEWQEGTVQPYWYQTGVYKKRFYTFDDLYRSLRQDTLERNYLVQKGIQLLTYRNNRFDIRVMVQQNLKRKWETTGIIGRVANPRKIVTNVHNGGTLKPVETLLASYLPKQEKYQYIQELKRLGLKIAKTLQKKYRGLKEIGVDVALDHDLKAWVLEVNSAPDPYIFRKLKDKSIFAKVFRYYLANLPKNLLKTKQKRKRP
jgi:glutathione synthase/RimK-type ligase-like ATP-grasp enzyme